MLATHNATGHAAEFLVCFDLSLRGLHVATNVFEHCPYDVLADMGDGRMLRIQVKGTDGNYITDKNYKFNLHKNNGTYDLVDLIALVAVDLKTIIYKKPAELGTNKKRFTKEAMARGEDAALLEWLGHK
jgi:hypothetical protein